MANFYVADQNKVAFLYESGTYATTSGTGQWWGLIQSHEIDENQGVISNRFAGTASRNVGQFIDGPTEYTGTITMYPQNWTPLFFALGKVTDAGSPTPYTHVISEMNSNEVDTYNTGTFPSFTTEDSQSTWVEGSGANFIRTVKGCTVDSVTLTLTEGEPVSLEVSYIAQSVTFSSGATTTVTESALRPFMASDFSLYWPSGTKVNSPTEISWTINNNLNPPQYVDGSRNIAQPIPENRDHELSITMHADRTWSKPFYDQYFLGGSTFNLLLAGTVTAGSRDISITYSGCKLTDMSAPTSNEGVNEWTLTIAPETASISINDDVFKYGAW